MGTKYVFSSSTINLKMGSHLSINRISSDRCLTSSSVNLSYSSYNYMSFLHDDNNDQAYIIDLINYPGREYEFETFTMVSSTNA